jgi:tetratricopeptide (TPR) repeat protein
MRVVLVVLVAFGLPASAAQLPSTGDLLERYARGDFTALIVPKTANDLGRLRQALERDAEGWVKRGDAKTQRKRQLVAATVALELAHASLKLDWGEGRRLMDWAIDLLVRGPADDSERLWHLAAISLLHAANDNQSLVKQQKQAWPRFNNEPRFLLGLIISLENDTWPDPDRTDEWDDDDAGLEEANRILQARRGERTLPGLREKAYEYQRRSRMRTAITLLEDLSNQEETRAEVLLRLGFLHMRLRHEEIALEQFDEVLTLSDEPFVQYLANLLAGTLKEQAGDRANAISAYRAALAIVPRAQSASFALATLLFNGGEREEAAQIIDAAISGPPVPDPWRTYQAGDYRFWDARIGALREVLK